MCRCGGDRPRTYVFSLAPFQGNPVAADPRRGSGLFVTTKTVETHLSRAYRKLGISGRSQLLDAFGPAAASPIPGA
jgi:hypothetical protein